MLVEFSVGNFRSFRERQTFSMVAGKKPGHDFKTGFRSPERVLQAAALFGANASGKSNLVAAMDFFRDFVIGSASKMTRGDEIEVTPFLFSKKTHSAPSEFEIVFIHEDSLYQYGFTADQKRVWEEWLYVTSKSGERESQKTLFERSYDPKAKAYDWRFSALTGQKKLWEEATRDNALFLSTAVQLNSKQLKNPYDWIEDYFRILGATNRVHPNFTVHMMKEEKRQDDVLSLMQNTDPGILNIEVEEREWAENDLPEDMPESVRQDVVKAMSGKKILEVYSIHGTDSSPVRMDFEEESMGTRIMFGLAGPLLDVLENGYVLVVDELHNSLHPMLLKAVVSLFHDRKINKNGAQLIFTGHETSVLEDLERDQAWLVEKDRSGKSILVPLLEYKPRPDSNLRRDYLNGRFGGLPDIERLLYEG